MRHFLRQSSPTLTPTTSTFGMLEPASAAALITPGSVTLQGLAGGG
ncbi:hypothetical protein [Rhodoferax ferrireducens]|nr:hypothetical protein [Rhodoferax ferrireducens]